MAGRAQFELLAAVAGLKPTIDAALALQPEKLAALVQMAPTRERVTDRAALPRIGFWLAEEFERSRMTHGGAVMETLSVEFMLRIEGDEATARLYEGTVAASLLGAKTALAAGLTDATLAWWEIGKRGSLAVDAEVKNREVWDARLRFEARLQWS